VAKVQVVMEKATVVACLGGDVDLATSDSVQRQLLACADDSMCRALVIDMRSVRFLDSQGLNMLMRLHQVLDDRDQRLFLVLTDATFLDKLVHMSRVDSILAVHHRLGDALAAAGSS
jgi:anti-anti-sigma factor